MLTLIVENQAHGMLAHFGVNLFVVLLRMLHPTQEFEPPANRGRFTARQDVFDYIEMFYNPKRKPARNGMLSPVDFERQHKLRHEGV